MISPFVQVIALVLWTPVAQLVALWGMTSEATLQLMMTSKRGEALAITPMQPEEEEEPRL